MQNKELKVQQASPEALRGIGELLDPTGATPAADSEVFSFWNDLSVGAFNGPVSFGMVNTKTADLTVPALERHTETTETLVPLDSDIVLVLGPPTNGPDLPNQAEMVAIRVPQGQGVTLNKGAWHFIPLSATGQPCRTLIAFRQGTPTNDLEVKELEKEGHPAYVAVL